MLSITASVPTLQNRASLVRTLAGNGCSVRQTKMSACTPNSSSCLTECWVGLVFNSPAADK